jgi:hypothetical protein
MQFGLKRATTFSADDTRAPERMENERIIRISMVSSEWSRKVLVSLRMARAKGSKSQYGIETPRRKMEFA